MITKNMKLDLDKLVEIGEKQNYRINAMLFYNLFLGHPGSMRTEEVFNDMRQYLREKNIEIIEDEVDLEEEVEIKDIKRIAPFNPNEIDIEMQPMSLDSLIKRIKYNAVNLDTDFQRKGGLWTNSQKSQLIESLLLKIPLPAFYFDGEDPDNWLIIDGLQRISTLKEFIVDGTLELTGLEFFTDLEGMKFEKLPRTFVRRIEETNIIAFIVKGGTPSNVKYNIFKRINTGGLELSPQEIRHALHQGNATRLCKKLASLKEFKDATSNSIKIDRMMDQEFVLRYVAVCYYGIKEYDGVPDNYLNGAMKYLNSKSCVETSVIEEDFKSVLDTITAIMGKYAFRKLAADGTRRPINKAIYEIWCNKIFFMNTEIRKMLIEEKDRVFQEFLKLCESAPFLAVIKASDRNSFLTRFHMLEDMLGEVLNDK